MRTKTGNFVVHLLIDRAVKTFDLSTLQIKSVMLFDVSCINLKKKITKFVVFYQEASLSMQNVPDLGFRKLNG